MRTTSVPGFQRGWRDAVSSVEGLPASGNRERDVRPVAAGPDGAPALYMWLDGEWRPFAAQGTGGFQMRFVEGEPSDSLGVNGDLAVDTASPQWDLYQKQSGAYVLIGQFRGAPGEPGAPGGGGESGLFADREFPRLGAVERIPGECTFSTGYEITVSESAAKPSPEDGHYGDVRHYTESGTMRVVRKIFSGSWIEIFSTNTEPLPAVLSGSASPDNGDGSDGDLYIQTSTGNLFQKSGGSWEPSGSSLNPPLTMIFEGTVTEPLSGALRVEDLVKLDGDTNEKTGIVLDVTGDSSFIALFVNPPSTGSAGVLSRERITLRRIMDAVNGAWANPVREIGFIDNALGPVIAWLAGTQSQRWSRPFDGEEGFRPSSPEQYEYGTAARGFGLIDGEPFAFGGTDADRNLRRAPVRSGEVTFTLGGPSGVRSAGHCPTFQALKNAIEILPLTTRRVRVLLMGNVSLDTDLDLNAILPVPETDPVEYQPLEMRIESMGNQRRAITIPSPYQLSGRITAARVSFLCQHSSAGGIVYDMDDEGQWVIGFEDCEFDNGNGGGVLQATGASSQPTFIFRNCTLNEGAIYCDMEEGPSRSVILLGSQAQADAIVGPGDRQWDLLLSQDSLADLSGSGYGGTISAGLPPARSGADADRPATPPTGFIRWNTTSSKLEVWSGTGWETFTPDT